MFAALSAAALLSLAACSDDDDNDSKPTPTPTPTASAVDETFTISCPPPIGTVTATSGEGQWDPAYVVDSDVVLYPVAFGEVTFVEKGTGQVHTEAPITKTGANQVGAITCTFHGDFPAVGEDPGGTLDGTVYVQTTKS